MWKDKALWENHRSLSAVTRAWAPPAGAHCTGRSVLNSVWNSQCPNVFFPAEKTEDTAHPHFLSGYIDQKIEDKVSHSFPAWIHWSWVSYLISISSVWRKKTPRGKTLIMTVACILPHQEEKTHSPRLHGSLLACRTSHLTRFHSTPNHRGLRVPTATQSTQLHIPLCQIIQYFIFTFITILRGRQGNGTVHWQTASQTFGQAMIWTPKSGLDLRNSGRQLQSRRKKDAFRESLYCKKDAFLNLLTLISVQPLYSGSTGFPWGSVVKNLPANAEDVGSIPGSGRSPGEGLGNSLQCSWLENPIDFQGPGRVQSMGLQRVGHEWAFSHRAPGCLRKELNCSAWNSLYIKYRVLCT